MANDQPVAQRPIGVLLWALVSDEVEERLETGAPRLRPQDWRSGDKLWVIEVIAPFGGHEAMVAEFKEKMFPMKPPSFVKIGMRGQKEVGGDDVIRMAVLSVRFRREFVHEMTSGREFSGISPRRSSGVHRS